jgi:hypothetical protein
MYPTRSRRSTIDCVLARVRDTRSEALDPPDPAPGFWWTQHSLHGDLMRELVDSALDAVDKLTARGFSVSEEEVTTTATTATQTAWLRMLERRSGDAA